MVAFVLCKLVAGLEQKALTQIRDIGGVKDVFLTFGSWDAILTAEADTIDKLSGLIVREIRGIHGVQTTETLVTTNL
ncbi:MAG: Lrp/AsnC ligand binding domain-containing protein [Elusimicrobia bacterium]|nr:Lrp/AsnC ligand binding domain-containing protein [Elusimicrobiota bacterium]